MAVLQFRRPGRNAGANADDAYNGYDAEEYADEAGEAYGEDEYDRDGYDTGSAAGGWSDFSRKLRVHRRRIVLRALLVVIVAAAAIVSLYVHVTTRTFTEAAFTRMADLARVSNAAYRDLGGRIMIASRDGANCYDTDGKAVWNITYEMQQPIIAVSGAAAAIADYNGSTVHVVSSTEILGTVRTNLPIRSIAVSEGGEVAAVLSDREVTWIYLYSKDGTEIACFKTTMAQTGYPVSVAISPGGEMVCVSFLHAGSAEVRSSIAFYNFGRVGQNVVDHYVSGFDYQDEVFPYVRFLSNESAVAVSGSRIVWFKGKEIPEAGTEQLFAEELLGVYDGTGRVGLLFPDTSGEAQYRLDIYDQRGTAPEPITFTLDLSGVGITEDQVVVHSDKECRIFRHDGTQRYRGSFSKEVLLMVPSSRADRLTVVTGNGIERMALN